MENSFVFQLWKLKFIFIFIINFIIKIKFEINLLFCIYIKYEVLPLHNNKPVFIMTLSVKRSGSKVAMMKRCYIVKDAG